MGRGLKDSIMDRMKGFFRKRELVKPFLHEAPVKHSVEIPESAEPPVTGRNTGWVSPVYSKSRPVRLDRRSAQENRCVALFRSAPEMEYYRVLRAQILQRTCGEGGKTLMVTSAHPGEGKTLTAINLALTFAREFRQTVLLVDCDLRGQSIHEVLGFSSDRGLANYLLDGAPVSDLIVWPNIEKLTVISGGRTIPESTEILGSPRMRELVAELRDRYPERYVIFDMPCVLEGADSLSFASMMDHILVVVQAGRTPAQDVRKALDLLPPEKILGVVLNSAENIKNARPREKGAGEKKVGLLDRFRRG
jgi:non-specific protein-tyrosine kinase